jgi:hypothetical protein
MKDQKGGTILLIMLIVAVAAIVFGMAVIYKRTINSPAPAQQASSTDTTQTPDETQPTEPVEFTAPANWSTYSNDKHGFSLQYPPNLKAGAVSANSVLGTFSVPVKGFHVGPLVLVVLKDASIKQDALDYFNALYNPSPSQEPIGSCTVDKVTNSSVVSIKSISCTGEGGAGSYAYIHGPTYDVFVDGYSKGYDKTSYGTFSSATDYLGILSTFKFSVSSVSSVSDANQASSSNSVPEPFYSEPFDSDHLLLR